MSKKPSELPLPERIKWAESLMDAYLDVANSGNTSPQGQAVAYKMAASLATVTMELRSRLALQQGDPWHG